MTKDIVSLGLDFKDNITQESSIIMITVDIAVIADITADAVILDDTSIANNSYVWCSDRHE